MKMLGVKGNLTLWATSKLDGHQVCIYKWSGAGKAQEDGFTGQSGPVFHIGIRAGLFTDSGTDFDETMLHEFVHVCETLYGSVGLNHDLVDECTAGAQKIGRGLALLLHNLQQVSPADRLSKSQKASHLRRKNSVFLLR